MGATVLDLYAGAGTLGLEALSRGADRALLVERDRAACRLLRRNVAAVVHRLALSPGFAEVWEADVDDALRRLGLRGRRFSLILADPPYTEASEAADAAGARVLARVAESELLLPGGWLVLEHARECHPGDAPRGLRHWTTRAYGRTALSYWFAPRPQAGAEERAGP